MIQSNILSTREIRRYQNQIQLSGIGLEGQEKIKQSKILIVGAGGKGTAALQSLVIAGVGYIGICDDKLVDEEDFSKQNLYGDLDIGKQKAIVSKQYLQLQNGFTTIKVHNIKLTSDALLSVIENYSVIIDATSDIETHVMLAQASAKYNKPCIFGTIIDNKPFIFGLKNSEMQIDSSFFSKLPSLDSNKQKAFTPLVVLNSIVGNILANEAIKEVLQIDSPLYKQLLIINISDYSFTFHGFTV